MLYIKNVSAKLIHIGSVMLKPDERVEDKVSDIIRARENVNAENYSDIPSVKAMIRMGLLELVEVVYKQKEDEKEKPEIKQEIVEVDELPEEPKPEPKKETVTLTLETDDSGNVNVVEDQTGVETPAPKKNTTKRGTSSKKKKEE